MARFCGNCGVQIDEKAKVCGQCGTSIDGKMKSFPANKAVPKKKFLKIVAVLFLLIVVTAVVNIVSQFTGYRGLIRKAMAAYENYDIDTLVSLSSDVYYYGNEDYVENYFENRVGDALDSFETSVGHNYKFSYEINEIYQLSNRRASEILNDIEDVYPDFDISIIKDIYAADITVSVSKDERLSSNKIQIIMTEENEVRKILYID